MLKIKYHKKLKEYKWNCKATRNAFWENTLTEIEQHLSNPDTFWDKWRNTNEFVTSKTTPNIPGEEW